MAQLPFDFDLDVCKMLLANIGFAVLCGGMIGLERGLKGKAAGLKTNILIAIGSMIFTSIAVLVAADPGAKVDITRIVGQVASGLGFIGAGVIMRTQGDKVHGLTTAAVMWTVAALGALIGIGHGIAATVSTIAVLIIVSAAGAIEEKWIRKPAPKSDQSVL